jgi:hypothetical protein
MRMLVASATIELARSDVALLRKLEKHLADLVICNWTFGERLVALDTTEHETCTNELRELFSLLNNFDGL